MPSTMLPPAVVQALLPGLESGQEAEMVRGEMLIGQAPHRPQVRLRQEGEVASQLKASAEKRSKVWENKQISIIIIIIIIIDLHILYIFRIVAQDVDRLL